jgi:transposase
MKVHYILGIDISKDKFDVCLRHPQQDQLLAQKQFLNSPAGFRKLQRWLRQAGVTDVHACMEATSRYGEALALFLHEQGQPVSVVNPRRIRRYADSLLVRTQHDALDADIIARFCATQKPRLWTPAPPELRRLQELTRLRQFLVSQRTRLQNRLHTESKTVAPLLWRHIGQLDQTVEEIEATITTFLHDHEELNQQVALAGLDPRKKDSGKSVRGVARLSKMGSRPLRAALYMAAITGLRSNPLVRAQAERLRARGKSGKTVICAAMRKLVRLIYGVLKHRQTFDPKWQGPSRAVPCAEAKASGGDGPQPAIASPPVATA